MINKIKESVLLRKSSSFFNFNSPENLFAFFLVLVFVTVSAIYFVNAYNANPMGNFSTYADDTYIHLRFAHNLASGYGIVWNIGDPPVEGSTSLLWMLMLAGIEALGFQPVWWLIYICAACAVLVIVQSFLLLQALSPDSLLENLTAATLLALSPRLMLWALTGLEVAFYAFVMAACAFLYVLYRKGRVHSWVVGIAFALSSFIRPESMGLFAITLMFDGLIEYFKKNRNYRPVIWMLASFLLVFLPIFFWKWSYFGYPFPNTYYNKTGGGWIQIQAGFEYILTNFIEILVPAGVLGVSFIFGIFKRQFNPEKTYLLVLFLAFWFIVAINGGDYMLKGRFITPSLPILYVMGGIGLTRLISKLNGRYRIPLLTLTLAIGFWAWNPSESIAQSTINKSFPNARQGKPKAMISTPEFVAMGRALKEISEPGESIALVPIGAVAFYSDMRVYDMVGLVDPVIAHEPFDLKYIEDSWRPGHDKGNGQYILSLEPTYIIFIDRLTDEPLPGVDDWALQYKSVAEIWALDDFHEKYEFFPIKIRNGWYMNLYRRVEITP
jgi:arabinofuranosyltransferase